MGDKKKGIDGKALLANIDRCLTSKEIFDLLHRTMDADTLQERLSNLSDNDLVIALNNQRTRVNIQYNPQYYTTHQDAVTLAAARYQEITQRGAKAFKIEANKEQAKHECKKIANQLYMQKFQR